MKLTKTQIYFIALGITLVLGYILWNMMFNRAKTEEGKKIKMGKADKAKTPSTRMTTQEIKTTSVSENQAAQRTAATKTWTNPKGMLCPAGVRAVRNADGTWTCISAQRSKCPSGYDVLYAPGTNIPKGCINLVTGKELPLQA